MEPENLKQMNKPINIDTYIAGFPEEVQKILRQLRAAIKTAAPNAEEFISYGMPGFKLTAKVKIWFAAYKKHIGMYPVYGLSILQEEIEPYRGKNTKDSLHFPLDKPLPLDLIGKIVKMKVNQS